MNRNQQGQGKKAAEPELLLNVPLANALGGPNPTLTTQALATRTAEKVFRLYFGGDPWVGREAPVSSIDQAVTQAVLHRSL